MRQRFLPPTDGARQQLPARVVAPHRGLLNMGPTLRVNGRVGRFSISFIVSTIVPAVFLEVAIKATRMMIGADS